MSDKVTLTLEREEVKLLLGARDPEPPEHRNCANRERARGKLRGALDSEATQSCTEGEVHEAARAIYRSDTGGTNYDYEQLSEAAEERFEAMARAALFYGRDPRLTHAEAAQRLRSEEAVRFLFWRLSLAAGLRMGQVQTAVDALAARFFEDPGASRGGEAR